MTQADQYLHAIINRHRAPTADPRPHELRRKLEPFLNRWSLAQYLEDIELSGSHPKQTALRDSDTDILLSLSPETPGSLASIHESLATHFRDHVPTPRNVSLRIQFEGAAIDLVPARRRRADSSHTLWRQREGTWLQTNTTEQIRQVRSSGLTTEILALKLWRRRHTLRLPSFLLELATIHALIPGTSISDSFLELLNFLATKFPRTKLEDPANSNNVVSDLLTPEEKHQIATRAAQSLLRETWPEIL